MEHLLGPGGELSKILDDFEHREGQVEMARAAFEIFKNGGALLVEAGTGTGKTLAYLVPAAVSGRKIIISTGTKNLQEQIMEKDFPVVEKLFPTRVRCVCMKGRGNYLCRRRFRNFSQQPLFRDSDEAKLFDSVLSWAHKTQTGDRAELGAMPDDYAAWSEMNSKSDLCLGSACPDYENCFITRMRSEAAMADIVVVNHHLFFADLNIRDNSFGEVIPRYDAVVFDEAHLVEDIAATYFGFAVSSYRIIEAVRDAERELRMAKISDGDAASLLDRLLRRSAKFFDVVRSLGGKRRRLAKRDSQLWADDAKSLLNTLSLTSDYLSSMAKTTEPVRALSMRFVEIGEQLGEISSMSCEENVYWSETRGKGVFLHSSPTDISVHLKEKLYPRSGSIVFTSATLSTDSNFDFIESRLGMSDPAKMMIKSHFDYERQAVLYLPSDLPEPASSSFAHKAADRIAALLKISRGRAFVLFTSHRNLEKCWELLDGKLPFTILKQGDAPRSVILDRFREDTHSSLFATYSFWQGVDVRGDSLSAVIIDKLPFAMPDDPLVSARMELIEKRGGSPFREYQLPSAALMLKQGFGRLIRSGEDRGLLAVLDRRMKTRSYGKTFFNALPDFPLITDLQSLRVSLVKLWGEGENR